MKDIPIQFERTAQLIGADNVRKLAGAHVAVFGLGGVGGTVAEALCRAGVGALTLCDGDTVQPSNLNRQAFALHSVLGMNKTDAAAKRLLDINPHIKLTLIPRFFTAENADGFDFAAFNAVADAIDSVPHKTELLARLSAAGVPAVSCMGAGNKLDPAAFETADLAQTSVCPLARVMRKKLKERGVSMLTVIYSKEPPVTRNRTPASIAFVPPAAGLLLASEIVGLILKG